jgi:hypothetical protein
MNIELLQRIADRIDAEPQLFDMSYFEKVKKCGTAHCIGGWAEALHDPPLPALEGCKYSPGQRELQLDADEAEELFYVRTFWLTHIPGITGTVYSNSMSDLRVMTRYPQIVAATLRRLADGEITLWGAQ